MPVGTIRGSGPAAERLRAFVQARVHKDGAHYQRGAGKRLAELLGKPASWVSNYVDPKQAGANADVDAALTMCLFFKVNPLDLLDTKPSMVGAPPTPSLTRLEARALRLIQQMTEQGQRFAVKTIAGYVDAFRKPVSARSAPRVARTLSGRGHRAHGKR